MWLGLHLPSLGLEVFEAGAGEPVVLVEEQRVVALNGAAEAADIVCGSTLATARSVCADIRHIHRDQELELARLRSLGEALYRFSSLVSLEPPDGLVLEVGGSRRLHADLETLRTAALELTEVLGHKARARLAPGPTAALLLARADCEELARVPLCAALPADQVEQLASMGMHQLAPLLALPEAELGQRFGRELVDLLGRLAGRLPDPREGITLAPSFRRELTLLDPIRDKQTLLFPMQRLLAELEAWLIARQLSAEQLTWQFAAQGQESVAMPVRFGQGRQRKGAFLPITRLELDRIELPEDVISLSLEARTLVPFDTGSRGLFELLSGENASASPSELLELLDELRARLGQQSCHGIASLPQHVPEWAWREVWKPAQSSAWRRALKKVWQKTRGRNPESELVPPGVRPAWLFAAPVPVERARLTLLGPPERIQTAWWCESLCRDYYLARHDSGACCWAFVDHEERWFLHGYFA